MTPQETINEIQKQLTDLKFNDGDYCLIVYKFTFDEKVVCRVYKTFSAFEQNISKCLDEIPEEYGVDIDIWQFD